MSDGKYDSRKPEKKKHFSMGRLLGAFSKDAALSNSPPPVSVKPPSPSAKPPSPSAKPPSPSAKPPSPSAKPPSPSAKPPSPSAKPPSPSAKPPSPSHMNPSSSLDPSFIQSLNALSLAHSPSNTSSASDSTFVGGFYAGHSPSLRPLGSYSPSPPSLQSEGANFYNHGYISHSSPSRPPPMPVPSTAQPERYSLTMQMALRPASEPYLTPTPAFVTRPHSTSELTTPNHDSGFNISAPTSISASSPITLTKSKTAVHSAPGTPSAQVQCAGITKAGEQCTRMVKLGPPLAQILGENHDGDPVTRFCFQHRKEVLAPSGFMKKELWVDISHYIPAYLQPDTRAALLAEMRKPGSPNDVHGYIYTYEIRDPHAATVKLKVGRTTNIVKRLDQWGKQCGSKEPIPRGIYPGDAEYQKAGSLVKGMLKPGKKTPWIHRLERLIHLELADLATTCIYLNSSWPNIKTSPDSSSASLTSTKAQEGSNGIAKNTKVKSVPCLDCGKVHKEIFEFARWDKGSNIGKEWELVVKPVIIRWGEFVNQFL